ncbi:unnamed protein product [Paramecium primaurelia]|uniref:Uncharacterized protein n=1 Tax=Paramecium primaurelia TaxID=5886 RepID=A0A8S1KDS5_PARPR|nr:unnamed protein product [Paramecium primaurelia]
MYKQNQLKGSLQDNQIRNKCHLKLCSIHLHKFHTYIFYYKEYNQQGKSQILQKQISYLKCLKTYQVQQKYYLYNSLYLDAIQNLLNLHYDIRIGFHHNKLNHNKQNQYKKTHLILLEQYYKKQVEFALQLYKIQNQCLKKCKILLQSEILHNCKGKLFCLKHQYAMDHILYSNLIVQSNLNQLNQTKKIMYV